MRKEDRIRFEGTTTATMSTSYAYIHPVTGKRITCPNEYQARLGLRAAIAQRNAEAAAAVAAER